MISNQDQPSKVTQKMPYDYSNKRIISMDKATAIKIAQDFAKLVIQYFDPIEIILYGSHAKGTANEESDIDIAVVVPTFLRDYLDDAVLLYRLRESVDDRIEPILLDEESEKSGFLEDVKKTGYRIYPHA
jgi:predicted nucleotidyltransferase